MNYIEKLNKSAKQFNSIVCLGLDPVIEDIPEKSDPGEAIIIFYENILNKIVQKKIYPSVVKPNYAFYAQYGFEGLKALSKIISLFKHEDIPVILDAKRGDIGKTARAYAKEVFDFFKADAVTLSPYMGFDSISPFIEENPNGGFYILTKTSNTGSKDFQDLMIKDNTLYIEVAKKIVQWESIGLGSVVGATYPEELSKIINVFNEGKNDIPLLIPGVGSQGGSISEVMSHLKKSKNIYVHRINSSSAINYAYKRYSGMHYADAAVAALKELNDEINANI